MCSSHRNLKASPENPIPQAQSLQLTVPRTFISLYSLVMQLYDVRAQFSKATRKYYPARYITPRKDTKPYHSIFQHPSARGSPGCAVRTRHKTKSHRPAIGPGLCLTKACDRSNPPHQTILRKHQLVCCMYWSIESCKSLVLQTVLIPG